MWDCLLLFYISLVRYQSGFVRIHTPHIHVPNTVILPRPHHRYLIRERLIRQPQHSEIPRYRLHPFISLVPSQRIGLTHMDHQSLLHGLAGRIHSLRIHMTPISPRPHLSPNLRVRTKWRTGQAFECHFARLLQSHLLCESPGFLRIREGDTR